MKEGDTKWRQNFFFVTITVEGRIPDMLKRKLLEKGLPSRAALVNLLIEGYLAGKYVKINGLFTDSGEPLSFKTVSMYYPKVLDVALDKHIEGTAYSKTEVLRGLIVAWIKGRISVDYKKADEKQFKFVTIKISKVADAKLDKKAETTGKSKSELIIELAKNWLAEKPLAGTSVEWKQTYKTGKGNFTESLSVQMPFEIDIAVEAKMKQLKIKYKTTLFRVLIDNGMIGV